MNRVTITFLLLLLSCGGGGGGGGSPPAASMVVAAPASSSSSASTAPPPPAPDLSPTLRALHECAEGKSDDEGNRATGEAIRDARIQIDQGARDKKALTDAVWSCFAAFQPSKAKRIALIREIQQAIYAIKDPSYGPKAAQLIEKPIVDPRDPVEAMNELQFHQAIAAHVLGDLRYAPGVRPLINALLTPTKRDLVYPVRLALHKMPKDAEPLLIMALAGSDPDFAKLEAAYPDRAYLPILAEPLSAISRPKGRDAVIDALAKLQPPADSDENRAMLAIMLTQFPKTDASTKAFFAAYSKVKSGVMVKAMGGMNARALMASSLDHFFDSAHADFLLHEIATAKGDDIDALPPSAFPVAVKLMLSTASSTAVGNAVKKLQGAAIEKDYYAAGAKMLDQCKKDVDCYLRFVMTTNIPTAPPSAKMGHIKAVWMIGVLTNSSDSLASSKVKNPLVSVLSGSEDGSFNIAILEVLKHLSPKGDETTAKALEGIVETNSAAGKKAGVDEMYRTALTLRSRLD